MQDNPAPFSVLVADAEPTICRVFEAKLTKEGRFRVACASTGLDAYRLGVQYPFDIILWDLRLRDSDTVLPRLRALCPAAALLLMTTDDEPAVSVAVSRLDVAGILIKPFGLDTLETHIRSALAQRRQEQPLHQLGFVGQYLTLRSPAGECGTRVFKNAQDSFLVVGAPRVATPPDFAVGQKVQVEYIGRSALYSFDSVLLGEVTDPLPCWELAMPSLIHRHQRRQALRTEVETPIQLHAASDPSVLLCEGTTTDLSVLGAAFLSTTDVEVGTQVQFTLSPDAVGRATVVRTEPHTDTHGVPGHRIALRFDDLSPETQAHLQNLLEKSDGLG